MDNDDEIYTTLGNITLDGVSDLDLGTITIANIGAVGGSYNMSSWNSGTYAISGGGNGGSLWTSSSPVWSVGAASTQIQSALKVSGDADIEGDLKVGGRSIMESLERIEKRLAILVPDPARLEKYQALQQAWEHFKTLEALCVEQDNDPDKG